jgi:hypothetical protein
MPSTATRPRPEIALGAPFVAVGLIHVLTILVLLGSICGVARPKLDPDLAEGMEQRHSAP